MFLQCSQADTSGTNRWPWWNGGVSRFKRIMRQFVSVVRFQWSISSASHYLHGQSWRLATSVLHDHDGFDIQDLWTDTYSFTSRRPCNTFDLLFSHPKACGDWTNLITRSTLFPCTSGLATMTPPWNPIGYSHEECSDNRCGQTLCIPSSVHWLPTLWWNDWPGAGAESEEDNNISLHSSQ
jgi:hypothetical protein